jgi:hypothetical protein
METPSYASRVHYCRIVSGQFKSRYFKIQTQFYPYPGHHFFYNWILFYYTVYISFIILHNQENRQTKTESLQPTLISNDMFIYHSLLCTLFIKYMVENMTESQVHVPQCITTSYVAAIGYSLKLGTQ